MWERSGNRGAARCDGRCNNDDVTFDSMSFSYIGSLCGIYNVGAFW